MHLGGDNVIPLKKVIAVIDFRETADKDNTNFLREMNDLEKVIDISYGNPKSLIITNDYVYISGISSTTLKKRAEYIAPDEEISDD